MDISEFMPPWATRDWPSLKENSIKSCMWPLSDGKVLMSLEKPMSKLLGMSCFHSTCFSSDPWDELYLKTFSASYWLIWKFLSRVVSSNVIISLQLVLFYYSGDGTFQIIWVSVENRCGCWYLSTRINLALSTTQSEAYTVAVKFSSRISFYRKAT